MYELRDLMVETVDNFLVRKQSSFKAVEMMTMAIVMLTIEFRKLPFTFAHWRCSGVNNNNKWMRNDLLVWESCECIHYCSFQLQFHLCMSSAILFARNTTPEKRTQVFFNCLLLLLLLFCLYCKCAVHRLLWLDKPVKCYLIMRRSWLYSSELGIYIFVSSVYVENSYECW